ncbi:MAG: hypothetical protein ACRC2R_10835 [Xenococcaceae cyanobacterium]
MTVFFSKLILPGHPLFDITLATPPPDWKALAHSEGEMPDFVMDATTGLFRTATADELEEYLSGGEYDEVFDEQEDEEE